MRAYLHDKRHSATLDLKNEIDISGKIVLITGASSGIGKCTAFEMAKRGANLVMACRDLPKSQQVLDEIQKKYPDSKLDLLQLDLSDLENVRKFVVEFKEKYDHIDILINNAGYYKLVNSPAHLEKTKDGFESHMGVNHLGPLLLTILLLDHLKKGAPSRIVFVASSVYKFAHKTFNVDDLMLEGSKSFTKDLPYSNSKYCNILTCRELSKRLKESGITCYALCPGFVATNLFRHDSFGRKLSFGISKLFGIEISPEKATENVLYCSLCKSISEESGFMYHFNHAFDDCNKLIDEKEELCEKLWDKSLGLVGIGQDEMKEIFDKILGQNAANIEGKVSKNGDLAINSTKTEEKVEDLAEDPKAIE